MWSGANFTGVLFVHSPVSLLKSSVLVFVTQKYLLDWRVCRDSAQWKSLLGSWLYGFIFHWAKRSIAPLSWLMKPVLIVPPRAFSHSLAEDGLNVLQVIKLSGPQISHVKLKIYWHIALWQTFLFFDAAFRCVLMPAQCACLCVSFQKYILQRVCVYTQRTLCTALNTGEHVPVYSCVWYTL